MWRMNVELILIFILEILYSFSFQCNTCSHDDTYTPLIIVSPRQIHTYLHLYTSIYTSTDAKLPPKYSEPKWSKATPSVRPWRGWWRRKGGRRGFSRCLITVIDGTNPSTPSRQGLTHHWHQLTWNSQPEEIPTGTRAYRSRQTRVRVVDSYLWFVKFNGCGGTLVSPEFVLTAGKVPLSFTHWRTSALNQSSPGI